MTQALAINKLTSLFRKSDLTTRMRCCKTSSLATVSSCGDDHHEKVADYEQGACDAPYRVVQLFSTCCVIHVCSLASIYNRK
eukprot:1160217-Pelagomonas_calceolata.AAC.13